MGGNADDTEEEADDAVVDEFDGVGLD